jgi:hypothetical protein
MNRIVTIKFDPETIDRPAPYSEFHDNIEISRAVWVFTIPCQKCNGEKCEHCEWTGTEFLGQKLGQIKNKK